MNNEQCRFCGHKLAHTLVDLGLSPLANEYVRKNDLFRGQIFYPLKVWICDRCFLAQAELYQQPEKIFGEYQYFSSYSSSWLKHCKNYVHMIVERLGLTPANRVLEIACNDGYLLQYFKPYGIPTKGIEPAENVAAEAKSKGIEVECCFFEEGVAKSIANKDGTYDLVIGNNVLAHVPDINSFVAGLSIVLSSKGTITMEFPHLMQLMDQNQFDTIYHEHFYYLSLVTVQKIFQKYDLDIYDVEELSTHGGSLRIYAAHQGCKPIKDSVNALLSREQSSGITDIERYSRFRKQVLNIKSETQGLLNKLKCEGRHIAAFGAAAKGNTFLNYCGIRNDIIDFVVDSNPHKQGYYLPGSLIPILGPEALRQYKPDYLLILPWNLTNEIVSQAQFVKEWGCQFISCIPEIHIFSETS